MFTSAFCQRLSGQRLQTLSILQQSLFCRRHALQLSTTDLFNSNSKPDLKKPSKVYKMLQGFRSLLHRFICSRINKFKLLFQFCLTIMNNFQQSPALLCSRSGWLLPASTSRLDAAICTPAPYTDHIAFPQLQLILNNY